MLSNEFINLCLGTQPDFINRVVFSNQQEHYVDDTILVVADTNTEKYLPFKGNFKLMVLPSDVKPEIKWINYIHSQGNYKTLLSFGAGTINDICKYASFLASIDFVTYPTAPSVNGYSSATASIITDGVKKSYSTHLPKKIYISLDVLANSPMRLILSGFGEVICKFTTKIDWLLSHLLFGTYYSDVPFDLIRPLEEKLILERDKLIIRDPKTIQILMEVLLLSGLGMNLSGGSYPWSQGEHQIVHTMEINDKNSDYFHGEKVSVATVTMSKLQNFVLYDSLQSNLLTILEDKIRKYYDNPDEYIKIFRSKHDKLQLNTFNNVSTKIRKFIICNEKLQKILLSVGARTKPQEVGWDLKKYEAACQVASAIRNRFTFLDILPYLSKKFDFC